MNPIDTTNDFMVGTNGEMLVILNPPLRRITKQEALRLAAWLVVMAGPSMVDFELLVRAVEEA